MTDITVTAAKVGLVDPVRDQFGVRTARAASTITKGQAVAEDTDGAVVPADASTGGAHLIQFRGVALNGGGAGQAIDYAFDAELYGFTVSSLDAGALVYLSNTTGALADGAGEVNVPAGIVTALPDNAGTKILRVVPSWLTVRA